MGAVYSSPTMAMYVHSLLCMYVCLQGAYLHSNIQFFVCVDSMRVIVDLRAAKYCFYLYSYVRTYVRTYICRYYI